MPTDRPSSGPALMEQLLLIGETLKELNERTRRTEAKIDALLSGRQTDTAKLDRATNALRDLSALVHQTARAALELAAGDPARHTTDYDATESGQPH